MRLFSNGGKGDMSVVAGAMFCSGCGLCETYSCPQGLSPRKVIADMKAAAREAGMKPPVGLREHYESIATMVAAYESAYKGELVKLDFGEGVKLDSTY